MFYKCKMIVFIFFMSLFLCNPIPAEEQKGPSVESELKNLAKKGLQAEAIRLDDFHKGISPVDFLERTGASYKPSYNEEPSIPAQCWIETGYGTQNACLYCHTDYLASIEHGNAFPLGEDQVLYSFPTADLNKVLWRNTIFPHEIFERLKKENLDIPNLEDVDYVRRDNWTPAFTRARSNENKQWLNTGPGEFVLFPALNPNHLFPLGGQDTTSGGTHGYIDSEGFIRDENGFVTGWRAINFFPYGIFTPLTGSVSGIYIRLPREFMNEGGEPRLEIYRKNLALLEKNIKNRKYSQTHYYGDAAGTEVKKGFFPVGTEFAHPLHYVDLKADGETAKEVDGVIGNSGQTFEFPGTRSKRIKEMRYMYKWKDVGIEDIDEDAHPEKFVIGNEGQGWVDNNAGWLLSGYIENRRGDMRAQTTEELMQCIGCHGKVGNTVDSVWSFQRKLPGDKGWGEMDYGVYDSKRPHRTKLNDYQYESNGMGERGYFYHTVVGADLYGVMPEEIGNELRRYAKENVDAIGLKHQIEEIFDDGLLKNLGREERKSRLVDRQKVMRSYVAASKYLYRDEESGSYYIKGNLFYPSEKTMKRNIELYRKIVLDQSYNLGKDVFGSESDDTPFTFRSDGSVKDAEGKIIPTGEIITSRPYNEEGEGITPTGIVRVNDHGEPVDKDGNPVDIETEPEKADGHISTGGTFDTMYNPILGDIVLKPEGLR
ncbi:MAG: hypothetical protein R6U13_02705 [Desulfatiglandaceae bacterium]